MGTEIMLAPAQGQGGAGGVSTRGAPELVKILCLDCIKVHILLVILYCSFASSTLVAFG